MRPVSRKFHKQHKLHIRSSSLCCTCKYTNLITLILKMNGLLLRGAIKSVHWMDCTHYSDNGYPLIIIKISDSNLFTLQNESPYKHKQEYRKPRKSFTKLQVKTSIIQYYIFAIFFSDIRKQEKQSMLIKKKSLINPTQNWQTCVL